jgi:hypothetical protein
MHIHDRGDGDGDGDGDGGGGGDDDDDALTQVVLSICVRAWVGGCAGAVPQQDRAARGR